MAFFQSIGKGIAFVGGGLIGGTVKVTGKVVGNKFEKTGEWLEEVGDSVQSASKIALGNAGQFLDGATQGTYGLIKDDAYYKQLGLENLKDSTGKTIKGIGSTINYAGRNIGDTYTGIKNGDKQKAIDGLKNIGKVVAVSGLAIGILDVIDGADVVQADGIDTRNADLNGLEHPDTGVPFAAKAVNLPDGSVESGVFPVFESDFRIMMDESIYLESDYVHFSLANDMLYETIQNDPSVINDLGLSEADVQALANGQTPEDYVWHHSEEPGVLQFVDREVHDNTGHTGGRSMWGGGSDYR